jgi:hypothetical protein
MLDKPRRSQVNFRIDDDGRVLLERLCRHYRMKESELFRFLMRQAEAALDGVPLPSSVVAPAESPEEYAMRTLPGGPYTREEVSRLIEMKAGPLRSPLTRAIVDEWHDGYRSPRWALGRSECV